MSKDLRIFYKIFYAFLTSLGRYDTIYGKSGKVRKNPYAKRS